MPKINFVIAPLQSQINLYLQKQIQPVPNDIGILIAQYVDSLSDLVHLLQCNRFWKRIIEHPQTWNVSNRVIKISIYSNNKRQLKRWIQRFILIRNCVSIEFDLDSNIHSYWTWIYFINKILNINVFPKLKHLEFSYTMIPLWNNSYKDIEWNNSIIFQLMSYKDQNNDYSTYKSEFLTIKGLFLQLYFKKFATEFPQLRALQLLEWDFNFDLNNNYCLDHCLSIINAKSYSLKNNYIDMIERTIHDKVIAFQGDFLYFWKKAHISGFFLPHLQFLDFNSNQKISEYPLSQQIWNLVYVEIYLKPDSPSLYYLKHHFNPETLKWLRIKCPPEHHKNQNVLKLLYECIDKFSNLIAIEIYTPSSHPEIFPDSYTYSKLNSSRWDRQEILDHLVELRAMKNLKPLIYKDNPLNKMSTSDEWTQEERELKKNYCIFDLNARERSILLNNLVQQI